MRRSVRAKLCVIREVRRALKAWVSTYICPSGMFRCPEGRCILSLRVCDYQKDCDKGEDEFQACRPVHTGDMRHVGRRILGSQVDAASQHSTV
uniref:Uncharacterized protein n=1 Tax=Timema poppense TaxID=170557 RepID=A0A7R9CQ55_TIMPO|nr:unnamed protein product [Timema poppensis]